MKFDSKITKQRLGANLKQKYHIFALVAILVLSLLMYITLDNVNTKSVIIWEGDKLTDCYLTSQCETALKSHAYANGIHKLTLLIRSPEDNYYDAAFTTSGMYNADIFILTEEELSKYFTNEIYADLLGTPVEKWQNNGIIYQGKLFAISLGEGKYMALNANSHNDRQLLFELMEIIYNTKGGK